MAGWGGRGAASAEAPSGARRFAALRNRNFALLWGGSVVSNAGSWMQIVAQGWLVYLLTGSPLTLGVVGLARAVPMIVLPLFGGTLADRVPRLKLLKVTQTVSFLLALALAALVAADVVEVWHIVLFGVLSGAVHAFDQPTRQALLPDIVRREELTSAIAMNSAAWQGSAMVGPALAGVTIAAFGIAAAFFINAFSYLAVIVALFLMRGVPERTQRSGKSGMLEDLVRGLRYVGATRLVLTLILLSAVANIFGRSYQQLLPVFAGDLLDTDSVGLGFMTSAPGVGTVLAAVGLAALGDVGRKGVVLFVSMLAFSAILIAFTMNRSMPVALALLFAAGITNFAFSTMTMTMLQLYVPGEVRGRVLSLVTITAQGFTPLGAFATGGVAERIGTPEAVGISALVVGVAAVGAAIGVPSVRRFVGA
ncbi:MAG: MFS transporter, partial [Chloroflexi bacterium]|nr:MFS transporter [Chloroflexota bacterium]